MIFTLISVPSRKEDGQGTERQYKEGVRGWSQRQLRGFRKQESEREETKEFLCYTVSVNFYKIWFM